MNVVLWMGAGALIFAAGIVAGGGIHADLWRRYKKALDQIDWYREERADFIDLANELIAAAGEVWPVEGYPRITVEVRRVDWDRLEGIAITNIRLPRLD